MNNKNNLFLSFFYGVPLYFLSAVSISVLSCLFLTGNCIFASILIPFVAGIVVLSVMFFGKFSYQFFLEAFQENNIDKTKLYRVFCFCTGLIFIIIATILPFQMFLGTSMPITLRTFFPGFYDSKNNIKLHEVYNLKNLTSRQISNLHKLHLKQINQLIKSNVKLLKIKNQSPVIELTPACLMKYLVFFSKLCMIL